MSTNSSNITSSRIIQAAPQGATKVAVHLTSSALQPPSMDAASSTRIIPSSDSPNDTLHSQSVRSRLEDSFAELCDQVGQDTTDPNNNSSMNFSSRFLATSDQTATGCFAPVAAPSTRQPAVASLSSTPSLDFSLRSCSSDEDDTEAAASKNNEIFTPRNQPYPTVLSPIFSCYRENAPPPQLPQVLGLDHKEGCRTDYGAASAGGSSSGVSLSREQSRSAHYERLGSALDDLLA